MTIPLERKIAGFNNRLLSLACRMNRISSGVIGVELGKAIWDLGEIMEADHVVLSAFFPHERKWEAVLRQCPRLGAM